MRIHHRISGVLALVFLVACGAGNGWAGTESRTNNDRTTITIAGSSTVYPLTLRLSHAMKSTGAPVEFTIANIGTGGGFRAFCTNRSVDVVNASRPITPKEEQACLASGRTPVPFQIGWDALAIAVSKQNTFLESLTVEQLEQIFSGTVTTWRDVDPRYPADPISLFSPGTDSGTFDYFIEVVMAGDATRLAKTAITSEDDDVLVRGIEQNARAIGYFGYAYYQYNSDQLRVVPIRRSATEQAVLPSVATVTDRSYPFIRPLFLYSDTQTIREKELVGRFLDFYLENVNRYIRDVGYFPEEREQLLQLRVAITKLRT